MQFGATITSRANERVKALRAALSGKASRPGELLGLEGWNLIEEAHEAGESFETVFVREGSDAKLGEQRLQRLRAREWLRLSRDAFDSAVGTETPQGIAATWMIREREVQAERAVVLVLEDVQDPGNVGTLIRSAAAFGCGEVMLTPGCASAWNPKTMRASAGAVFRVRARRLVLHDAAKELRERGARVFAAVASGEDGFIEADAAEFASPCAVMIGNEGAGLTAAALGIADERVRISCRIESLNAAVAGSILLYEAMRRGKR